MAGRNPLPSKLHVIRGSCKVNPERAREDPEAEGKPPSSYRKPLPTLNAYYKLLLRTAAPGILGAVDETMLRAAATAAFAMDHIDPEVDYDAWSKAARDYDRFSGKLGLSPVDRAKLGVSAKKKADGGFAKFRKPERRAT